MFAIKEIFVPFLLVVLAGTSLGYTTGSRETEKPVEAISDIFDEDYIPPSPNTFICDYRIATETSRPVDIIVPDTVTFTYDDAYTKRFDNGVTEAVDFDFTDKRTRNMRLCRGKSTEKRSAKYITNDMTLLDDEDYVYVPSQYDRNCWYKTSQYYEQLIKQPYYYDLHKIDSTLRSFDYANFNYNERLIDFWKSERYISFSFYLYEETENRQDNGTNQRLARDLKTHTFIDETCKVNIKKAFEIAVSMWDKVTNLKFREYESLESSPAAAHVYIVTPESIKNLRKHLTTSQLQNSQIVDIRTCYMDFNVYVNNFMHSIGKLIGFKPVMKSLVPNMPSIMTVPFDSNAWHSTLPEREKSLVENLFGVVRRAPISNDKVSAAVRPPKLSKNELEMYEDAKPDFNMDLDYNGFIYKREQEIVSFRMRRALNTNGFITWSINNVHLLTEKPENSELLDEHSNFRPSAKFMRWLRAGFLFWSEVTPIHFKYVENSQYADILLDFTTKPITTLNDTFYDTAFDFDKPRTIYLDVNKYWHNKFETIRSVGQKVGRSLGLWYTTDDLYSIMNPSNIFYQKLTSKDVQSIQELYGSHNSMSLEAIQ